eukprot:684117-Prorocentrum_minimum.AAC.3
MFRSVAEALSCSVNACLKALGRLDPDSEVLAFLSRHIAEFIPFRVVSVAAGTVVDARGLPTTEVTLTLADGRTARAACPAGDYPSVYEIAELRDENVHEYNGLGVRRAVNLIHEHVVPTIMALDTHTQETIDEALTLSRKPAWPSNATYPVSAAAYLLSSASASASAANEVGSAPRVGVLLHTTSTGQQIFCYFPGRGASPDEGLRRCVESRQRLQRLRRQQQQKDSEYSELEFWVRTCTRAIADARHTGRVRIGVHARGSESPAAGTETETFKRLCSVYDVGVLIDPFDPDDPKAHTDLKAAIDGSKTMLVGDAAFSTRPDRLHDERRRAMFDAVCVRPSQAGTVTEATRFVDTAQRTYGFSVIFCCRSGETSDGVTARLARDLKAAFLFGDVQTDQLNHLFRN